MTTDQIIQYYSSLLILQYNNDPKAIATIQALVTGTVMDQLPLQVQNGFTIGDTTIAGVFYPGAVGVQLDIIGKYAGVTRFGVDTNGNPITLNDMEFTTLIKVAIIKNNSGSSLADIDNLLQLYFPNEIFVFDGADMQMSYLISSSVGDQALVEVMVTQNVLPKPMGVQLSEIIYIPTISLFGFQDYNTAAPDYSGSTTYGLGATALSSGIVYSSLQDGNVGNPVSDATFWIAIIYPMTDYTTMSGGETDGLVYTWLNYSDGINIL